MVEYRKEIDRMSGEKKQEERKVGISAHADADGVCSTALFLHAMGLEIEDVDLYFPDEFGDYREIDEYMFDMTPSEGFEERCVDHHDQHPDEHEYRLTYGEVPASRLVYNIYGSEIPQEERWKVAVGCAGDMDVPSIPNEVLGEGSKLEDVHTSIWEDWDEDELQINPMVAYKLLPSPINAACRVGNPKEALLKLYYANRPSDLIYDEELASYKKSIREEVSQVIKKSGKKGRRKLVFPGDGNIGVFVYSSDYRISGIVSSKLHSIFSDNEDRTIISINTERGENGKGSIRSDRTGFVAKKLREGGIEARGHRMAAGVDLGDTTVNYLLDIVRSI